MSKFDDLIKIAQRKFEYDKSNPWYEGSGTYLSEIKNEVDEVIEEIPKNRVCYLEDELADVLWDYVNAVLSLEKEKHVSLDSVLARACIKYEQRITAIENGKSWDGIKQLQKTALAEELLRKSK